jgi:2-polyprenyl-3-methyl-5-hydroxy-6-metoxy-1,4-benzoquinol methylase
MMRNLDNEFRDNVHRKYAYTFDYQMHGFMLRTFAAHLIKGRALELGCFEGEFTKRLADLYDDLTVVEGASELVAEARKRVDPKVKFVLDRFENFEPSEPYDAIFFLHTLEHIDQPIDLLRRVGTWLSKGGRLFLAVPNAYAASRQIAVAMGIIPYPMAVTEGEAMHGHQRTYSMDTLKWDVNAAGLKLVDFGGIFFKPLANFQIDQLSQEGIIKSDFLEGCYQLGKKYPDLCASIYAVCEAGSRHNEAVNE